MPKTNKKAELGFLFDLEPKAAVEYLQNKGYKVTNDWRELWEDAHAKAFTVSKMTDMELLKDTKGTFEQALKEGWSSQKTQRELTKMYKTRGWWGKQEVENENGTIKTVQLGSPYRVRTIYRQNIQSAYNAGRYLEQMKNVDIAPYLQYICVLDERTRPEHKAMHLKVFRYDDPIWAYLYPPNGFGCRCMVRQLTQAEVDRMGLKVESSSDYLSMKDVVINEKTGETKQVAVFKTQIGGKEIFMQPDAGWSSNVGKAAWNIDVLAFNSVKDLPQNVKDRFISEMAENIHTKKAYQNFVKNILADGMKSKGLEQPLTWIAPDMLNILNKNKVSINTPVVVMQDDRIGHIIGSKVAKQKISEEQLYNLYDIINNPDAVYFDYTKSNTTGLVYIRNIDDTKCLKVCVKLNKFKSKTPVNYISTAGIVDKTKLNSPLYRKIE